MSTSGARDSLCQRACEAEVTHGCTDDALDDCVARCEYVRGKSEGECGRAVDAFKQCVADNRGDCDSEGSRCDEAWQRVSDACRESSPLPLGPAIGAFALLAVWLLWRRRKRRASQA